MATTAPHGTCSSPALLHEVRRRLAASGQAAAVAHLDAALTSRQGHGEGQAAAPPSPGAPLRLFRTLDELELELFKRRGLRRLTYAQASASPELAALAAFNCHNGQRKLAVSLIEFLGEALSVGGKPPRPPQTGAKAPGTSRPSRPSRPSSTLQTLETTQKGGSGGLAPHPVVVYAGASGLATTVAATLFPHVRFVLYDDAPNTVQLISRAFAQHVVVHAAKHPSVPDTSKRVVVYRAWFDDAEARKWGAWAAAHPGVPLLFVSDVRSDRTDEPSIARDMASQQRWALLCGCRAYMFKFRVPYAWGDDVRGTYTRGLQDAARAALDAGSRLLLAPGPGAAAAGAKAAGAAGAQDGSPTAAKRIPYLDGRLHLQLYGPQTSAELRLIGHAQPAAAAAAADTRSMRQHPSGPPRTGGTGGRAPLSYRWRWYDVAAIEDGLATFNAVYRSHARFAFGRHGPAFLGHRFPGYDAVAEMAIAARCSAALGAGQGLLALRRTTGAIEAAITEFLPDKTSAEGCTRHSARRAAADAPPGPVRQGIQQLALPHIARCRAGSRGSSPPPRAGSGHATHRATRAATPRVPR